MAAAFRELTSPRATTTRSTWRGPARAWRPPPATGSGSSSTPAPAGSTATWRSPGGRGRAIAPADYYQQTKYRAEPLVNEYHGRDSSRPPSSGRRRSTAPATGALLHDLQAGGQGAVPMFGDGAPSTIRCTSTTWWTPSAGHGGGEGHGRTYLIATRSSWPSRTGAQVAVALASRYNIVLCRSCPWWCGHAVRWSAALKITPPFSPAGWTGTPEPGLQHRPGQGGAGLAPKVGLAEGLRRTAQWYREEGFLPKR